MIVFWLYFGQNHSFLIYQIILYWDKPNESYKNIYKIC